LKLAGWLHDQGVGLLHPHQSATVPHTPVWLHEKYDGYRLRVERQGERIRLINRNGYDWTKRYPWIVEAALKNRRTHFVIDCEAVRP
jgi:bifunctional non-homologous end joining protein LigD